MEYQIIDNHEIVYSFKRKYIFKNIHVLQIKCELNYPRKNRVYATVGHHTQHKACKNLYEYLVRLRAMMTSMIMILQTKSRDYVYNTV